MTITTVYIIVSLLTAMVDFVVAGLSFMKRDFEGRCLGLCLTFAGLVDLTYLSSVYSPSYFAMSLSSSLSFASVDIMALSLLMFSCAFTGRFGKQHRFNRVFVLAACVYAFFDVAVLLVNPFQEISLTYAATASFPAWRYAPHLLYYGHLAFCYLLIAVAFLNLIVKMHQVPSAYRSRYSIIVWGVFGVILLNAVFLFIPSAGIPDISVLFYSAVGVYIYCSAYYYSERTMLNQTRELIINEMGRPLVLFDYENRYATSNEGASFLLPQTGVDRSYELHRFLAHNSFDPELEDVIVDRSFYWRPKAETASYRVDFSILHDDKGRFLGRLFILTDNTLEMDLLTGFMTQSAFERAAELGEGTLAHPSSVAVCDLNGLAHINAEHGREAGDAAIRYLAEKMRLRFPADSFFARLDDAELLAVCPGCDAAKTHACLSAIASDLSNALLPFGALEMQSAVYVVTDAEPSLALAARNAVSSMRARKLLDPDSAHSSLLDSFVQTQRESDGETESHVQRTREMGEHLGRRLGFSDLQLSRLALLCLLHDIGKVGVPLEILNKPGKLNDAEWQVMKSHTEKGYRIAKASPELADIAELVLHHHEAWDGTGYPDGLKGESIPLLSRVIAIVDTYDAMTHDRPYRPAMSSAAAKEELRRCAGTQFDPYMVSEFLQMLQEQPEVDGAIKGEGHADLNLGLRSEGVVPRGSEDQRSANLDADGYSAPIVYGKYLLDGKETIIEVGDNFEELTGYTKQDIEEYRLTQSDLIFVEDCETYFAMISEQLASNTEAYMEHRLRRKDGSAIYVLCHGRMFFDSATREPRTEVIITDISNTAAMRMAIARERRSAERSRYLWEDAARKDSLTGILNHEAYRADLQDRMLEDNVTVLMFMMDLDYFKDYNTKYGHPGGDRLLCKMAQIVESATSPDGLACRIGGDEFSAALFFEGPVDETYLRERAHSFYANISGEIGAYDSRVTVSMGATISNAEHGTFKLLYQAADKALYDAKDAGRGQLNCDF